MSVHSGYSTNNELSPIVTRLNLLTFKQRSQLVNTPVEKTTGDTIAQKFVTSFLSLACLRNDSTLVEFLIKKCGAQTETLVSIDELWDNITFYTNVSKSDINKHTPMFNVKASILWHCCRATSLKMIKTLVENGADVNSNNEINLGITPLMVACAKNRLDIVKFLVQSGANIHQKDKNNETCLFYASK
jgi:hypothetical protein